VRHLTPSFAAGALRRGKPIEQFLGPAFHGGRRGIRWVAIEPGPAGFSVLLHLAEDVSEDGLADITEFPPLDPEAYDLWPEIATAGDEVEAIEAAERLAGADPARWTNFGVAADEYRDYVRLARLPFPLSPKNIVEVIERLCAGGAGAMVEHWWLEAVSRQTGCDHLTDLVIRAREELSHELSDDEIVSHVLGCHAIAL
jgi:hypothetical protein